MVFRKPYAFLIKNFKKIHIAMFVVCLYIFIKVNSITAFIKDYVSFGTYNSSLEPFSKQAGIFLYLAIFFVIGVSITLIVLLRKKNKPWKIYLVYIFEYLILLFGLIGASNFFLSYTATTTISGVLAYRDILNISKYLQFLVFFLLGVRIFGIDIKKFDFNKDEEFLELSEEDRAEFEININFDKHSVYRKYNGAKRNLRYFYLEHRFICNIVISVLTVLFIGYTYYYFGILHRSYKQYDKFRSGNYEITIKDAYVSDKDFSGKVIEKNNKFVVVRVHLKNITNRKITPNLDRYHLMNGSIDKTFNSYNASSFSDFGDSQEKVSTLKSGGSRSFYMVYKVPSKLNNRRFVMYYQELGGKLGSYLRKIKLKVKDVSKIDDAGTFKTGDKITFVYASGKKEIVTFREVKIDSGFYYRRFYCSDEDVCEVNNNRIDARSNEEILYLSFASSDYEGREFIDFSNKYGKINYINSKGKRVSTSIKDAIGTSYEGKEMFIRVDKNIATSSSLEIVYTLRNKRYVVKLK